MCANSCRCNTEEDLHLKRPRGYFVCRIIYESEKDTNRKITAYTYKCIHHTMTSLHIGVSLSHIVSHCELNDLT